VNSAPIAGAIQDAAGILDTVPEAYVCLDSKFRCTFLNRARERLMGEDRAGLLGKVFWEVYPALVGTRFGENCRRAMTERVPVTFEDYDEALRRWYAFTATPDSAGGIVVGTVDITGRKRAEAALTGEAVRFEQRAEERTGKTLMRQRSVSRFQHSLLAAAPLEDKLRTVADAIVRLFDADFCRIWLIRPGDLCERGCIHAQVHEGPHVCRRRDRCLHLVASSGRYTHTDGPAHRRIPFGCHNIGRLASGEEAKFLTNDVPNDPRVHDHAWARELGLISFAGYQLRTPGEETLGVLALFAKHPILADEDALLDGLGSTVALLVKRAAAEEALVRRTEELARSNKDLEQFAYVASHDLQEPLRMVSSYTQLLARRYRGQLDAAASEFIAYAVDGASRMQKLIDDLLAYSRVGTRATAFQPTGCTAVLDRALANLKAAIETSGAVVTHGPLPAVVHDNLLLVQLFQNLIGNAIKFHVEKPPRIHVSAEQKGEEWVFAVRDNGIGIDPQHAERIFTIFQRLHTAEEYPGTGIGLAICKKIVERRGGRIWVESQPGTGSTFYFTIPMGGDGL
jgi:PAS domain S-box-containing protein